MRRFAAFASSASIGIMAIAMAPSAAFSQSVEIIYNSVLPPFNVAYLTAIRDFAASIEEESGGTITVTVPDTALAPGDRQYEGVRDGIIDMALINVSTVSQLVELDAIGELPGLAPTSRAASIAQWETYKEYFEEVGEWEGVKVLGSLILPGRQMLSVNSNVAPATIEDLRGMRIWATSTALSAFAQDAGGVPMDTPFLQLSENVFRGNLDILLITPSSADSASITSYVTHITNVPGGLGSVALAVIISEERWAELNEEQQAAVLRAADGLSERVGAATDAAELRAAEKYAAIPVTNVEGEALEGFHSVMDPQIDDWIARAEAAGIEDGREVVDFYRSVLEREAAN